MIFSHHIVQPGYRKGTVISEKGKVLTPPDDWSFLPAGDAAVTKKVKAKGDTWVVQVQKGRRKISRGIWANAEDIRTSKQEVEEKRATPEYKKRRHQELKRKEFKHDSYKAEFSAEVFRFLTFHQKYEDKAWIIAALVTEHATPVGSGTVARTTRIPVEERAKAAVIAWMRHRATSYESMNIARIKGRRREVRRMLAVKSLEILEKYRNGDEIDDSCPLHIALKKSVNEPAG